MSLLLQLQSAQKVVGLRQSLRAIRDGQATTVFLAADAEDRVTAPILAACREAGLTPVSVETMAALGEACGVHIGAAVAAIV